jgi:hypothetical protein
MPINYFKAFGILFLLFSTIPTYSVAQNKRTLEELINTKEPGWKLVQSWMDSANNNIEVLPVNMDKAKETLLGMQVTTRSPMGAIVFNCGGILVDHGWIRILGSGNAKLNRTLYTWNSNKTLTPDSSPSFVFIADDAIGGYFALNGGGLGTDMGKTYYFDPASLKWEPLDLTYSEFLLFCFNDNLEEFYSGLRWRNWEKDVAKLDGSMVFNFYPTLWSNEGKDINKNSRNPVPVEEQYSFTLQTLQQFNKTPK